MGDKKERLKKCSQNGTCKKHIFNSCTGGVLVISYQADQEYFSVESRLWAMNKKRKALKSSNSSLKQ